MYAFGGFVNKTFTHPLLAPFPGLINCTVNSSGVTCSLFICGEFIVHASLLKNVMMMMMMMMMMMIYDYDDDDDDDYDDYDDDL